MPSNNLKKLRAKASQTQREVASQAGVPLPTYRYLEQTGESPRLDTAARIARTLGVPPLAVFPELQIPPRGHGRALFLRFFSEEIDKLQPFKKVQFDLGFPRVPDLYWDNFLNPLSPRLRGWPEAWEAIRSTAAAAAAQGKFDELIREFTGRRLKAEGKAHKR